MSVSGPRADVMHKTRQGIYDRLKQLAERKAREDAEAVVVPELETDPSA